MAGDGETRPGASVAEWIERLRTALPRGRELTLAADEQATILELAGIAAHSSERIAAPLSAFLAGVALGDLPPGERTARLQQLVQELSR